MFDLVKLWWPSTRHLHLDQSPNRERRPIVPALLAGGIMALMTARALAVCVGDCDGSGAVTVNELLIGVNIALENAPVSSCPGLDRSMDGVVTIDELQAAVNAALNGCPVASPSAVASPAPSPTRTPTHPATRTATVTVTATPTPDLNPQIPARGVYRTYPGYPIEFSIGATDPQGGTVTYVPQTLPPGAQLAAGTGLFDWTPATDQTGAFYATFTARNDEVPPRVVPGQIPFKVQVLDSCTVPACAPATGCTSMLVPLAGPQDTKCCTQEPTVRVPEPSADCPVGSVVFVGRNEQGFGRLQNCDRLRVFNQGQVGATMRLNIEARCLNITQPAQVHVQVVTKNRGAIVDRSQPVNLAPGSDGYAQRLLLVAPVIVIGPFFDFEDSEADVTATLTDVDGLTVTQRLRVVLTFEPLDDLPETP